MPFSISVIGLVGVWTGLGGLLIHPVAFAAFFAVLLIGGLSFAIDAARLACARPDFELRSYNRWWIYIGVILASASFSSLDLIAQTGVIRSIRPFSFPSGSMIPTLQVGERGLGDMRAYRDNSPERGDVALFVVQRRGGAEFVSRIVGLPGDRIQMKTGTLHINGEAVPEVRLGDVELDPGGGYRTKAVEWRERLPGGQSHLIHKTTDGRGAFNNTPEFVVPADHYFMMGDNRDNASDSRDANFMGFVPRNAMLGRMAFIYWPKSWNRMGKVVE